MITLNFSDFERVAAGLRFSADQVPFALSQALNDATKATREEFIKTTWPAHMKVRNRSFIGAALRREFATKGNLRAAIVESGPAAGRGNLTLHAQGGAKRPHGKRLAIPPQGSVRRGAHGVPAGQKPRAIIDRTPKRALRVTNKGIFVGEGGRLTLKYAFAASARIRPEVPFEADFKRVMTERVWASFRPRFRAAILSGRKRK